jgi:hypothetical protein
MEGDQQATSASSLFLGNEKSLNESGGGGGGGSSSEIYKYCLPPFLDKNRKKIKCNVQGRNNTRCKKEFIIDNGLSGVRKHLQKAHKLCLTKKIDEQKRMLEFTSQVSSSSVTTREETSKVVVAANRFQMIHDNLIKFVLMTDQPLSIIENEYFRDLLCSIDPQVLDSISSISRESLATDIKARAIALKEKLKEKLKKVDTVAITTDLWTSPNHTNYAGITAHFYHQNVLNNYCLDLVEMEGSHTAENIQNIIGEALKEYEIEDKIVAITTDAASNMVKAFSDGLFSRSTFNVNKGRDDDVDIHNIHSQKESPILQPSSLASSYSSQGHYDITTSNSNSSTSIISKGIFMEPEAGRYNFKHVICSAHALNLVVQAGLAGLKQNNDSPIDIVSKVRCLFKKILHTKLHEEYKTSCAKYQMPPNMPPIDTPIRWNSSYKMLLYAHKYFKPLNDLKDNQHAFEYEDWILVKILIYILEPFARKSEVLCGEAYSTNAFAQSFLRCAEEHIIFVEEKLLTLDVSELLDTSNEDDKNFLISFRKLGNTYQTFLIQYAIDGLNKLFLNMKEKFASVRERASTVTAYICELLHPLLRGENLSDVQFERACQAVNAEIAEIKRNTTRQSTEILVPARKREPDFRSQTMMAAKRPHRSDCEARDKRKEETNELNSFLNDDMTSNISEADYEEFLLHPYKFWAQRIPIYPILAKVAMRYSIICSTSSSVERLFSSCKLSFNNRHNIDPKLARDIIFAKQNTKTLDKLNSEI